MFSQCKEWFSKQRKRCNILRWSQCTHAEKASMEFANVNFFEQPPELRHQSLPRRLLGSFLSERNVNEENEKLVLKRFLKEHGLYNNKLSLEQRRRLQQLLELERLTMLKSNDRNDDSVALHSLPYDPLGDMVEIHSCPLKEELPPEPAQLWGSPSAITTRMTDSGVERRQDNKIPAIVRPIRRAKSLSMLPSAGDNSYALKTAPFSQATIPQAGREKTLKTQCSKTISWNISQEVTNEIRPQYLETSV